MNVFAFDQYKPAIRERARELSKQRRSFTLKAIAERIPIQYTYLSRALNHPDTHLNEDDLFSLCQILELFPDEAEYLRMLRALEVSRNPARISQLKARVQQLKRSKDLRAREQSSVPAGAWGQETKFLLSPTAWLTYFALGISELRENPKRIAQRLGIAESELLVILKNLSDVALIEIDGSPWKVRKVLKSHFHYGPTHPLTRSHQQMLKLYANAHLMKLEEDQKKSILVTFNCTDEASAAIWEKFREFLQEAERIAVKAPSRRTYQLIFDLFPWF